MELEEIDEPDEGKIYNYCDRWCERCLYTDRCRIFVMEKTLKITYHEQTKTIRFEYPGIETRTQKQK